VCYFGKKEDEILPLAKQQPIHRKRVHGKREGIINAADDSISSFQRIQKQEDRG
jgi:hypothetical protein